MKRNSIQRLFIMMTVLLAGCFEIKQEYTINPDGSGKTKIEVITNSAMSAIGKAFGKDEKGTPEMAAAKSLLEKSKGVEVWKDITYGALEDGRVYVRGTAYFSDIHKLKIDQSIAPGFEDKDGQITLTLKEDFQTGQKKKLILPADKSKTERMELIQKDRSEFLAGKAMIAAFLSGVKIDMTIEPPGKIVSTRNFKKDDKGRYAIGITGSKLIESIDKCYADTKWLESLASEKKDVDFMEKLGEKMNEQMFGTYGASEIVVKKAKSPLFDYAKEVEAARPAYEELLVTFNQKKEVKGAQGDGFKSLRVVGGSYTHETIDDFFIREGYKANLFGEFSGQIAELKTITVTEAMTDNNENLVDEYLGTPYPNYDKERTRVNFEVNLKRPSDDSKFMKSMKGDIVYVVGQGQKELDLGFTKIEVGAKGAKDSEILEFGPGSWEGYQTLRVKAMIPKSQVIDIKIYDGKKEETEISHSDYGDENSTEWTFSVTGEFPKKMRVVVTLYDKMNTFTAPFEIKNADFFGRPLSK